MAGRASLITTFLIIWNLLSPSDVAASITSSSTSTKAFSIILVKKGIAAIVSGTMAAVLPVNLETPVKTFIIDLVKGINQNIKIKKGRLLKILTKTSKIL